MEECSSTPCADFFRPVEELEYACLLKSTFTETSHVRGLDEVDSGKKRNHKPNFQCGLLLLKPI
jgi:hypothetical protein